MHEFFLPYFCPWSASRAHSRAQRPGCRGGSRYFEGYHVSSRSQRFENLIVQKYQDSTPIQNCSKIFNIFFKTICDLLGFTYVLRLSTIVQDLLRFHHRIFRFLFKTLGDTNCFRHIGKIILHLFILPVPTKIPFHVFRSILVPYPRF